MARKYKRLRYEDRKVIEKMLSDGKRVDEIAAAVGIHQSTLYKEFKRSGTNELTYTAEVAQATL